MQQSLGEKAIHNCEAMMEGTSQNGGILLWSISLVIYKAL